MWACHRGSTQTSGGGRVANPGTQDINAWCPDVQDIAVVGEGRRGVVAVNSANGACLWRRCWRGVDSILTLVSCGNGNEHACIHCRRNGIIEYCASGATEGEIRYAPPNPA